MCGICGFTGRPDNRLIKKMTDSLRHRGPDDEGFYVNEDVTLGMRRLSIIDLVKGKQPITNEDKTVFIVFNGEIYNFLELREELGVKGHRFYTKSDTEVIVHLYEEYGLDFPGKMNGMFAIALWDDKKKQLILVRDRMGVKPLYYTIFGRNIAFSSELKSLLFLPKFKRKIDYESLSHYLSLRYVPSPRTIFQEVFRLEPGELAVFKDNSLKLKKYWRLRFQEHDWRNEAEIVEEIYSLLEDAVRLRMRSDVPVGAYLSGGLDSSFVVSLMTKFHPGRIKTFCLAYVDNPLHKLDRYYARKISKLFGTEHYEYVMSPNELPEEIVNIAKHFDEPFSGVVSSYFLTKLVKKHVKVILSGDGADDQFGSYGHHRMVWPIENYLLALKEKRSINNVDFRPLEDKKELVTKFSSMKPWEWRLYWAGLKPGEKEKLISDNFKNEILKYKTEGLIERIYKKSRASDPLNRMLNLDINTLLPDEILTYADRLSMAHSVELRSPFLDYRLVELVATIPGQWKIKDGILKYILKKTAVKNLPQEILERPKEGFVLPKDVWLSGPLKDFLQEKLSTNSLKKHGFFKPDYVQQLIKEQINGIQDHTFSLWTLLMFQVWYEIYMFNS